MFRDCLLRFFKNPERHELVSMGVLQDAVTKNAQVFNSIHLEKRVWNFKNYVKLRCLH